MYYELYIDVFFLENFMIDSLLLLAVGRVMKCGRSYGRIVLGGILGSLLTCLVIVIPLPAAAKLVFFHVIINSLMIIAGLKITSAGQFVKALVLLYLSAVVAGGAVQLFRPWENARRMMNSAERLCLPELLRRDIFSFWPSGVQQHLPDGRRKMYFRLHCMPERKRKKDTPYGIPEMFFPIR